MKVLSQIYATLQQLFSRKPIRLTVLILAGVFILTLTVEFWLNFRIRASLRRNLTEEAGPGVKLESRISWMNLRDLAQGRIKYVRLRSQNCIINHLGYQELSVDNHGFNFDLPVLLKEKRLKFLAVHETKIQAVITEKALQDYLNFRFAPFQPQLQIFPGRFHLTGRAELYGNTVPLELDGYLTVSSPKHLRFYPNRLLVANKVVPRDFLQFFGTQLPLEFPILENWPLRITGFTLKKGVVTISFQEIKISKR